MEVSTAPGKLETASVLPWTGRSCVGPGAGTAGQREYHKTLLLYHLFHGLRLEALQPCHSINAFNESGILLILCFSLVNLNTNRF